MSSDFYLTSQRKKGVDRVSVRTFTLRLTDEQISFIGEKAKELGVSKNDYIRRLIDGDIRADKQDKILQEIIEIKEMLLKEQQKK